jgi:hypothetical protein
MNRFGFAAVVFTVLALGGLTLQAADAASRAADGVARNRAKVANRTSSAVSSYQSIVAPSLITDPVFIGFFYVDTTVDFGDGTPQQTFTAGAEAEHTYATPGAYTVSFADAFTTTTLRVIVPFDSERPEVYGLGFVPGTTTNEVQFLINSQGSTVGTIDYGDGSPAEQIDLTGLDYPTHIYAPGSYTATFSVTDGVETATGTVTLTTPLISSLPQPLQISSLTVTPTPSKINQPVAVSIALKLKGLKTTDISGSIDFGDGSPSETLSGTALSGIMHTYTSEGVFQISVSLYGSSGQDSLSRSSDGYGSASAKAFAVVGQRATVNSTNGLVESADVTNGDGVSGATINYTLSSLDDTSVSDATTEFSTISGSMQQSGLTRAQTRDVADGLTPSRVAMGTGLTVAKSTAKSASGATRGVTRKTKAVGSRQINPADSGNVKPPKNDPGVVNVSKVSGKFIFKGDTGNKPDKVTFSGTLTLPEGFAPSADGTRFVVGLGNVLDGVVVDAKGKPLNKSKGDNTFIQKVSIKFPKLPTGVSDGTEVAKITMTMSTLDMDLKGFESEGVTNTIRSDEAGRKSVPRFMQVNLLLAGEPYEAYVPVEFKLSSKADAGSIVSRVAR